MSGKALCWLLLLLPYYGQSQHHNVGLFPIRVNNLWGFIDTAGRVVIAPRFLDAGDFSEGLAPVRVGGRYGYVNARGRLQINAQFHYAESFVHGRGKVWLDGKPFFIDRKGKRTADQPLLKIYNSRNVAIYELSPDFGNYVPFQITGNKMAPFFEGQAVINTNGVLYEIIDSTGSTILELPGINLRIVGAYGGCIRPMGNYWAFTAGDGSTQIWNHQGKFFFKDLTFEVSLGVGHQNLLVRGSDYYGKITYYDHLGKIVWQEKPVADSDKIPRMKLNRDEQLAFFPYSIKTVRKDLSGVSQNTQFAFIQKTDTTTCDRFPMFSSSSKYAVLEGYFVNNAPDTFFFSDPYMGLEALDANGEWKDILYHPAILCRAGSDWQRHLAPGEGYLIPIPDFEGEIATQIRLVVRVKGIAHYSNPVPTRLNPGQFWRNPVFSRSRVLQPYTDSIWQ